MRSAALNVDEQFDRASKGITYQVNQQNASSFSGNQSSEVKMFQASSRDKAGATQPSKSTERNMPRMSANGMAVLQNQQLQQ